MEKFTVHTPGLVYLKANKSFSGDHKGMWYRLQCTGEALSVCVWPLPYCFDKTDDAQKTSAEFPFDAEGLEQAERWIEQQYESDPKRWAQNPFLPLAVPDADAPAESAEAPDADSPAATDDAPAPADTDAPPALSDDDAPPFDL